MHVVSSLRTQPITVSYSVLLEQFGLQILCKKPGGQQQERAVSKGFRLKSRQISGRIYNADYRTLIFRWKVQRAGHFATVAADTVGRS